jgi:hypothetical protein
MDTVSDAIGFGQIYNGHSFYWLTFPSEHRTFVYDTSIDTWHERSFYNSTTGVHEEHFARHYTYYNSTHYVGGRIDNLYIMSDDYRDDNGALIRRRLDSQEILDPENRRRVYQGRIEIEIEQGLAATEDDGHMLEWSDDGGKTWSNQRIVEAGNVGGYDDRVVFRRLGQSRSRIYRYTTAHEGVDALLGAYVIAAPGLT